MRYFAIGDIHGEYDLLVKMLENWDCENETLILLGDLVDRGPDAKKVVQKAMELQRKYNAIVLKGNHEELLLDFIDNPHYSGLTYPSSGGDKTLESFLGKRVHRLLPEKISELMREEYDGEIKWLRNIPTFYEDKQEESTNVFVHGGVDFSLNDWKETPASDMMWIRREFIYGDNPHKNTRFYFGHTKTRLLHSSNELRAYISPENDRIGIDGGAYEKHGGLIGVKVDGKEYESIIINKKEEKND